MASPEAMLERLAFSLTEKVVVPVITEPHLQQAVAIRLHEHLAQYGSMDWFASPKDGLPAVLGGLQAFLQHSAEPFNAQLRLKNTDAGFFVTRFAMKLHALSMLLGDAKASVEKWQSSEEALNLPSDDGKAALGYLLDMNSMAAELALTTSNRQKAEELTVKAISNMADELRDWSARTVDASVVPVLRKVLGLFGSAAEVDACVLPSGLLDTVEVQRLAARGGPMLEAMEQFVKASLSALMGTRGVLAATTPVEEGGKLVGVHGPLRLMQNALQQLAELPGHMSEAVQETGAEPAVGALELASAESVLAAEQAQHDDLTELMACTTSLVASSYRSLRKLLYTGGTDAVCLNAGALTHTLQAVQTSRCHDYIKGMPAGGLRSLMSTFVGVDGPSLLERQVVLVQQTCKSVEMASVLKDAKDNDSGTPALEALVNQGDLVENWDAFIAEATAAAQDVLKLAESIPSYEAAVSTRLTAAVGSMQLGKHIVQKVAKHIAKALAKIHQLANLEPDTTLQCFAGRLPDVKSLVTLPLFDSDFTVFSVTLHTVVFCVPVYLRMGILLNFHARLESGRCNPLPATAVLPKLTAPPPTQPYSAMAPVFEVNLRVEVAAGVGVPLLGVGLSVEVTVLGLGLPLQADVSLEHGSMSMGVRPYMQAGGGVIRAEAQLLWFKYRRTLYAWKGYRRTLASFCWNSKPDKFSPCLIKRERLHDPGARNPGNAVVRADVSSRCFLCAPVKLGVMLWGIHCPMSPDRFDALAGMTNVGEVLGEWKKKPWDSTSDLEALVLCGERFAPDATGEWVYQAYVLARVLQKVNRPDQWYQLTVRTPKSAKYVYAISHTQVQPSELLPPTLALDAVAMLDSVRGALTSPAGSSESRYSLNTFIENPDAILKVEADGSVEVEPLGDDDPVTGAASAVSGMENEQATAMDASDGMRFRRLRARVSAALGTLQANNPPQGGPTAWDPTAVAAAGTMQCFQCNMVGSKLACPRLGRRAVLFEVVGAMADSAAEVCWKAAVSSKIQGATSSTLTDYNDVAWVLLCNERVEGQQLTGTLVVSRSPAIYLRYTMSTSAPSKCTVEDVSSEMKQGSPLDRAVMQLHLRYDEQKETHRHRLGQCLPSIQVDVDLRSTGAFDVSFPDPEVNRLLSALEPALTERTGACYECKHSKGNSLNCAEVGRAKAERKEAVRAAAAEQDAKKAFAPSNAVLQAVLQRSRALSADLDAMLKNYKGTEVHVCDEFLGFNNNAEPHVFGGVMCARAGFERLCFRYMARWDVMANAISNPKAAVRAGIELVQLQRNGKNPDEAHLFLFDKELFALQHDPARKSFRDKAQFLTEMCSNAPAGIPL